MLEEFFRDKKIVDSFAKNYKTGEVLPDDLFAKMLRADAFGRGRGTNGRLRWQHSLGLHDKAPEQVNIEAMWKQARSRWRAPAVGGWELRVRDVYAPNGVLVPNSTRTR